MQVEAAFKWGVTWGEFKEMSLEDRVVMIAYVRASGQMKAIEVA